MEVQDPDLSHRRSVMRRIDKLTVGSLQGKRLIKNPNHAAYPTYHRTYVAIALHQLPLISGGPFYHHPCQLMLSCRTGTRQLQARHGVEIRKSSSPKSTAHLGPSLFGSALPLRCCWYLLVIGWSCVGTTSDLDILDISTSWCKTKHENLKISRRKTHIPAIYNGPIVCAPRVKVMIGSMPFPRAIATVLCLRSTHVHERKKDGLHWATDIGSPFIYVHSQWHECLSPTKRDRLCL